MKMIITSNLIEIKDHKKLDSLIKKLTYCVQNGKSEHLARVELIKMLGIKPKISTPELLKIAKNKYEFLIS